MDWKGLGYLVSILSVFLLGAIAWPTASEPRWHMPVLVAGMATSICGMGFRYLAHLQQTRELRRRRWKPASASERYFSQTPISAAIVTSARNPLTGRITQRGMPVRRVLPGGRL